MAKTPEQKAKAAAYARANRKKNPDMYRSHELKKNFGITLEQYNVMLETQEGVCAICKNPETTINHQTKKIQALSVDHCHTTGKIRGLLCNLCNTGLGKFRENPDFLAQAISYVIKHK
jgi:hypothetical protein